MRTKMMVVDDEPDLESLIRQKFRKQIRENDYEFIFAQNGIEALAKIAEHPDTRLILSDINMPEMDGLTLLHKLGDLKNPILKAVIVSAYGDMENIRTAMNRGAFDFITKPIDFNDLELTINKTLEQIELNRKSIEEHQQLVAVQHDLTIASRIQQSILPQIFPPFPDRSEFDIYAEMIPAKDVGGDFYDFFFIDHDRLAFVVGDVSGKGVPAAIFMAVSRTLLKAIASQVVNPGECLRRINSMLIPEKKPTMFVTIFYGILNTRTGEVQYSNGGHNSPYIMRAGGSVTALERTGGLFLGMIGNLDYDVKKISLLPGDTLFMYTDGVTEAMDPENNQFEEDRLVDCLRKPDGVSLEHLVKRVSTGIKQFVSDAPQSDDITMLAVRYKGR
jgi:sigma-B regulation protein RsbU (phosphoserine phosphatase)